MPKKSEGIGAKYERCVKKNKGKPGVNPYAVCRAALQKKHGKRKTNRAIQRYKKKKK